MSDYTKIQNWVSLVGTAISGTPFDTEFASVATASATKSNKIIPAATNALATLSGTGDLQDSGISPTDVEDAVSFHYTTGDIKLSAIDSEPTGWLYASGQSVSTSTYAALFAAIGYTYGGSGAAFNVPDFRGRSPAGKDNLGGSSAGVNTASAADSMGGADGFQTVTLTTSALPSHRHYNTTGTGGTHNHEIDLSGDSGNNYPKIRGTNSSATYKGPGYTETDGGHSHSFYSDYYGSGGSHENVSPTRFMNYLIKT